MGQWSLYMLVFAPWRSIYGFNTGSNLAEGNIAASIWNDWLTMRLLGSWFYLLPGWFVWYNDTWCTAIWRCDKHSKRCNQQNSSLSRVLVTTTLWLVANLPTEARRNVTVFPAETTASWTLVLKARKNVWSHHRLFVYNGILMITIAASLPS